MTQAERLQIAPQAALSRRRWLLGASAAAVLGATRAIARQLPDGAGPDDQDREQQRLDTIRRRAAEAGLPELQLREGERYVALGTAPEDFIGGALKLCEGLADDYFAHFKAKGFAVEVPTERMAMVALADSEEFVRFLEIEQSPDVTGVYELDLNHLVLYDGRTGSPAGPMAERANTITLFHEATHQLTFNTGLLDRMAEVPLIVSEGLAMYGEVRRPDGRTKIGAMNFERREVIAQELRRGGSLLPLADLIDDDSLFERAETVQLAYAQSWLFVYGLMRNTKSVEQFRALLDALRSGDVRSKPRLDLAREHLGDLELLDDALRVFAARLIRGR